MQLAKLLSLVVLISLVTSVDAFAQLRERWAARREERLNRLEQANSPRNAPAPNPQQSRAMPANPSLNRQAAPNAIRGNQNSAALGQQRINQNAASNSQRPNTPNAAPANSLINNTTANGKVTTASASSAVTPKPSAAKPAVVPDPIPKNSISYRGPGVVVEMPKELEGEIKFLIDDTEVLSLTPGEKTELKTKGEYVVRFSRGETKEKSFGEARYSITEGTYRFAVTARGWELYRQPDAAKSEVASKDESDDSTAEQASKSESSVAEKLQAELDARRDSEKTDKAEADQIEELPRPEPQPQRPVVPEPKPIEKKDQPKSILER